MSIKTENQRKKLDLMDPNNIVSKIKFEFFLQMPRNFRFQNEMCFPYSDDEK